MFSSLTSRLQWPSGESAPTFGRKLEMSQQLDIPSLATICEYLSAQELENLARLCPRIQQLAFYAIPGGGEALWPRLFRRDHPLLMRVAEPLLPQQGRRFQYLSSRQTLPTLHSINRPAVRVRGLAALERSSTWPATRADVLAQLYPALLSIRTFSVQRILEGHTGEVLNAIQLADGRLASASSDNTVRIWSLDGVELQILAGHNTPVLWIIQLADGSIASASYDRTVCIWGCDTHQLVLTATRQARYRKATHYVSRTAILALGCVFVAWGVNALLKTIARGFTYTT